MESQTTVEIGIRDKKPIDKNLGKLLDRCLAFLYDADKSDAIALLRKCNLPPSIEISENDVLLSSKITRECGK